MVSPDAVLLVTMLVSSGTQATPALPGGIIAWIVCNGRKRNPIGGWLMFYYWQLFGGLLLSAVFFASTIQSYVPENFDSGTRFALFLASAAPGLILLLIQASVATLLLSVRTWNMLRLLRWTLLAQTVAAGITLILEAAYFPENQVFSVLQIIQEGLWLAYFFRSTRVRHVFNLQDWDIAVNSIYPPKLKVAT